MSILVLGLVIFLGLHSTRIISEKGRAKAIARFGENAWKGIYSLLSAIGLVLIVWGFARARHQAPQIWTPPSGARAAAILLMLVSMLLLAGYFVKRSRIAVAVHHPMVWSVAAFGLGHLIANGSLADVVLFGAFLLWALADLASSYARDRQHAIVYPAPRVAATVGAIVLGVALWAVIGRFLHLWLFGVSPMAG